MTSIGSNIASSSGASSSGGPLVPAKVSLTLEEQLQNFERIICKHHPYLRSLDATFFKSVAKVVKELRNDPCGDIQSLLPLVWDPDGLLRGTTPLHWAVLIDDRAMVHYILSSGMKVDINALTKSRKETALLYAVIGGNHEIVKDLEHKADVFMCSGWHQSAFAYIVAQKDSMFGILKSILADNVNVCDQFKNTALHYAAREGAVDVVAYLLNEKADVNLPNDDGYTPLHYAAEKGSLDVVTRLLQRNADVNALTNSGKYSPLYFAARIGPTDIVSLLLQHNADVDALDIDGMSPLLHAICLGRVDTSNALIGDGANVHGKDKKDNNALHVANYAYGEEHNPMDIVKLL